MKVKWIYFLKLTQPKPDRGFTLIELTIVIFIIGILAAFSLPVFLSQAGKARQAGAKILIGKVNRAQQVYRVINGTFASDYSDLDDFDAPPISDGYTFSGSMAATNSEAVVEAQSNDLTPQQPNLCGIATFNTTDIEEDSAFGNGSCP